MFLGPCLCLCSFLLSVEESARTASVESHGLQESREVRWDSAPTAVRDEAVVILCGGDGNRELEWLCERSTSGSGTLAAVCSCRTGELRQQSSEAQQARPAAPILSVMI